MNVLFERLLEPAQRSRVVRECAGLLERHLRGMTGLGGILARAAFDALRRFRPAFVTRVLDRLLPDFLAALDDAYARFAGTDATGADFSAFMRGHPDEVIAALLRVTDARVARLDQPLVRRVYAGLRRMAEREIGEVIPDLAAHLPEWLHDEEAGLDEATPYLP